MAASKALASYRPATRFWGACIGDSYTFAFTLGVAAGGSFNIAGAYVPGFWPFEAQQQMRHSSWPPSSRWTMPTDLVTPIKFRNFGVAGDTTGQMIARQTVLTQFGIPDIVVIYGGRNDSAKTTTVSGSGATTTSIPVQSGHGADFIVGSYLLISGESRIITAVSTDTLTVSPALSGAPANATSVAIDTQANITALGAYAKAAGCTRIAIVGKHYDNFSASGDTTSAQLAGNQTLRGLQSAAATAIQATDGVSCIYIDTYAFMRNLIVNAIPFNGVTFVQGDFKWHVADADPHPNGNGGGVIGWAVGSAIKTAWASQLV